MGKKKSVSKRLAERLGVPEKDLEKVVGQLVDAVVTPPLTVAVTAHPRVTRPPTLSLPRKPRLTPSLLLYLAKQLRVAAEMLQDEALQRMEAAEAEERDKNAPPEHPPQ